MPYRPPKKKSTLTGRRPSWNNEPDYWLNEKRRQDFVDHIRSESTRFISTGIVCPGCDTTVWEADRNGMLWSGCHCLTTSFPFEGPLTPRLWRSLLKLYNRSFARPGDLVLVKNLDR